MPTKEELLNPQSSYYKDNPYALRPGEDPTTAYKQRVGTLSATDVTANPSYNAPNPSPDKSIVNSVIDATSIYNQQAKELPGIQKQEDTAKAGMGTAATNISTLTQNRPSQETSLATERSKYGIEAGFQEIQALMPDISSLRQQINDLNTQEAQAIENLQGQGRGIPLDVLNTQANKISHEYAIRTNSLAANLAAKSATMESLRGNITLASSLATDAVNAKMYDTNQKIKDWQDFFTLNKGLYDSLSKDKKDIIDNQYLALKDKAAITKAETEKKASLMVQYPKAGITIDDDMNTIAKKINANPYTNETQTYETPDEIITINKGTGEVVKRVSLNKGGANLGILSKPENSAYYKAIKSAGIGSSTPQRQEYENVIGEYLASGDTLGAKQYIARVAMEGYPAADQTKTAGRIVLQDSLIYLKSALTKYSETSGDTNILKGSLENVIQKVGQTTDPKLAGLKQEIDNAYVQYRSAMTGAQFSENESAEYRSILPNITNSNTLNVAKIDAFLDTLERNQASLIRNKITPQAYEEIFAKPIREAKQKEATENIDSEYNNYLKGLGISPASSTTTQGILPTIQPGGYGLSSPDFNSFFSLFK